MVLNYNFFRLNFILLFNLTAVSLFGQVTMLSTVTDCGSSWDNSFSMTVQQDGKILQSGISGNIPCIVRYDSMGVLDPSFADNGKLFLPWNASLVEDDIKIQSDGKIVFVGNYQNGANINFILARFNQNGTTDSLFGTNGKIIQPVGTDDNICNVIAFQSDGKIIAAGEAGDFMAPNHEYALVRFDTSGTIDTTFGNSGIVLTHVGPRRSTLYDIVVQSDDKIVVTGYHLDSIASYSTMLLVRYNSDGTLDNSFGTNGIVHTKVNPQSNIARAVALQSDGKIVIAGHSSTVVAYGDDNTVVRFNTDGSIDSTFGINGAAILDFYTSEWLVDLVINSEGKIFACGRAQNTSSPEQILVLCFDSTGVIDQTFGYNGVILFTMPTGDAESTSICLSNSGEILLGGYSNLNYIRDYILVRITSTIVNVENSPGNSLSANVFPNPSSDKINLNYNLENNTELSILLFDNLGRVVQTFSNNILKEARNHSDIFDVDVNLPAGIYYVKIVSDDFTQALKWIKQ